MKTTHIIYINEKDFEYLTVDKHSADIEHPEFPLFKACWVCGKMNKPQGEAIAIEDDEGVTFIHKDCLKKAIRKGNPVGKRIAKKYNHYIREYTNKN